MRDCGGGGVSARRRVNLSITVVYAAAVWLCMFGAWPCGVSAQIYWEKLFDSLSYESNIRPVPRRDAAVGYDVGRNRIVVFGGWQTNTDSYHYRIPVLLDDTWEFNLFTSMQFCFILFLYSILMMMMV